MKMASTKVQVIDKILHCRPSKQFANQIALLCDGNATSNMLSAVKDTLWQLFVAYLLK